ncbi:MAG: Spy/CpxP family protein refolding chaperone [Burkholderiales bacterium]|nr:Spy/CpxP family protein refolding chaperone [Burkholderiales bacterium]
MKVNFKPVVLAAVLATSALAALAQSGPGPTAGSGVGPGVHQSDGERHAHRQDRMKEHMAKRAADLKAKLKLSAEQESNWNAFLAAMKPPTHASMPKREDMAKLSTPERLDKMNEMRKQRDAAFEQRDAATRTFYNSLNAEQKKVFDENTARLHHHGPHRGHG